MHRLNMVRMIRVVRRTQKRLEIDVQKTRMSMLLDLQDMFSMVKMYATSKDPEVTPKQRQIWVRIMAYLGQVINSISNSFDEAKITEDLKRLEKLINEALATNKTKSAKPAS